MAQSGPFQEHCSLVVAAFLWFFGFLVVVEASSSTSAELKQEEEALGYFENYCFGCHDGEVKKGNLDLANLLKEDVYDRAVIFENLITAKMPPVNKKQPNIHEKKIMLEWLSKSQIRNAPKSYRRISRSEFVHSVNDLLSINLDLKDSIPDDRGTFDFDSDRRVLLTREMLASYFSVADEMLEFALPSKGFLKEKIWFTNKVKDSHNTYNIYTREYKDGILFSWTRANNGNDYSFFYDNFIPPVKGWYELSFDAMKLGQFNEDISIQVFAGKYYYADDRPQPQRLLDVISLGNRKLKSHTIKAFLYPGENVSVHCYSKHTFRKQQEEQGAYIKQLKVRGPVLDEWPPESYQNIFSGLSLKVPRRETKTVSVSQTKLQAIGGSISVSSFQKGMGKEKMQDGSNKTFWHTRFQPTLSEPPHYVILENPKAREIQGLSYATWSGGNGNGQVKAYAIYFSEDGKSWGNSVLKGELETRLANEQKILFTNPTKKRFIKFLITDSFSLDGRSLASIGKLDVLVSLSNTNLVDPIVVSSRSSKDLKKVIKIFAQRAFSSSLTEEELAPYYQVSLKALKEQGDFVVAAKVGLKAVLGSHRFLMVPGEHVNESYRRSLNLSRILWLSVPDEELLELSKMDELNNKNLESQINRMLQDERSKRMIHSFCAQWLNLRSFNKVTPSLKLYPLYDSLVNYYLPLEVEAYLNYLIQKNLSVTHLIDSDFSFLNQRLAQHYGIDGVIGQKIRKVTFGPEVPRGGLLTMGSILKVTTDGFDTSPILRGAWISKNIVGNTLSPPPENIQAIEPDHSHDEANLRAQIEQHKNNQVCFSCHKNIDPYGFALENFDSTGRWRTQYRVKLPHQGTFQFRLKGYYKVANKVDASGEISNIKFVDVSSFKKILLSDQKKVAYNFSKKFFEYANGYKPRLNQRIKLYSMISKNDKDSHMKDLIKKILIYSLSEEQNEQHQ